MTAALVRSVCNKMGALRLKSIPRENVSDLCETILEMIKPIESSRKPPSDLLNLVSNCSQQVLKKHSGLLLNRFTQTLLLESSKKKKCL